MALAGCVLYHVEKKISIYIEQQHCAETPHVEQIKFIHASACASICQSWVVHVLYSSVPVKLTVHSIIYTLPLCIIMLHSIVVYTAWLTVLALLRKPQCRSQWSITWHGFLQRVSNHYQKAITMTSQVQYWAALLLFNSYDYWHWRGWSRSGTEHYHTLHMRCPSIELSQVHTAKSPATGSRESRGVRTQYECY